MGGVKSEIRNRNIRIKWSIIMGVNWWININITEVLRIGLRKGLKE